MERKKFLRYWPVTLVLTGLALFAVLAANSTPAQAISGERSSAIQGTPPVSTLPAPTVVVTAIIPDTGGDTIIVDFFSGWVPWAVLGAVLIVLLVALVAQPRGPVDPGSHHHHDV